MNYGTLLNHVKRNLGNRQDSDFPTLCGEWLNSGYLDLVTTGKFPEAGRMAPVPIPELDTLTVITTGVGGTDWPLPALFLFPISARDETNRNPLHLRDIRWYDRYKSSTNGIPSVYVIHGKRIYIDPPSGGVYQIRVRYRQKLNVPSLTGLTDVPVVGEEWHEGIELCATYRGARSLQLPTMDTWLRDLKAFMAAHSEQGTEEEEDADIGFRIVM